MEERIITSDILEKYREFLISKGTSETTIKRYYRDIKIFSEFAGNNEITSETVTAYKYKLKDSYTARYINSILSSINGLFVFLGWRDLRIKTINVNKQIDSDNNTKAECKRFCNEKYKVCRDFTPEMAKIIKNDIKEACFIRVSNKFTRDIVCKFIDTIVHELYTNKRTIFANFGSFKIKETDNKNRLDPKTGLSRKQKNKQNTKYKILFVKSSVYDKNITSSVQKTRVTSALARIAQKELKKTYHVYMNETASIMIINHITQAIKDKINTDGGVRIMNFGKFEKYDAKLTNPINPRTGQNFAKKSGQKIAFTPSLKLEGYYNYIPVSQKNNI